MEKGEKCEKPPKKHCPPKRSCSPEPHHKKKHCPPVCPPGCVISPLLVDLIIEDLGFIACNLQNSSVALNKLLLKRIEKRLAPYAFDHKKHDSDSDSDH